MVSQFLITHFGLPSPAVGHKTMAAVIREYCVAETLNGSRPRTQGTSRDRGRLFLYLRGSDLWRIRHLSAAAESIRWGDGKKRAPRSFVTNQRYNGRAGTVTGRRRSAAGARRGRQPVRRCARWVGGRAAVAYWSDAADTQVAATSATAAAELLGLYVTSRSLARRPGRCYWYEPTTADSRGRGHPTNQRPPRTSHCRSGWRYHTAAQN